MEVKRFVSRDTIDMATACPEGAKFTSLDNLVIDTESSMYIVEDQPGGLEDSWYAVDRDNDGVAEATGLYFDSFNPHLVYINVQHPDSGLDRTIMLMAPAVTHGKGSYHQDKSLRSKKVGFNLRALLRIRERSTWFSLCIR
mgnify:CR=1 FL=1